MKRKLAAVLLILGVSVFAAMPAMAAGNTIQIQTDGQSTIEMAASAQGSGTLQNNAEEEEELPVVTESGLDSTEEASSQEDTDGAIADEEVSDDYTAESSDRQCDLPRLKDKADLLTEEEAEELTWQLDEVSEEYQCDVIILTVNDTKGKDIQTFADDFYDKKGYGYTDSHDGLILVIDMGERQWAISTTGSAIDIFTDAGQEYITDTIVPYLSDGDYYEAFTQFASLCSDYLGEAAYGEPYDVDNMPDDYYDSEYYDSEMSAGSKMMVLVIAAVVIGLIGAAIRIAVMKRKLKSVSIARTANAYVKGGRVNLTDRRDVFLYHTINRVPKPKNDNHGGSSVHMGGSGTMHGGSHGGF